MATAVLILLDSHQKFLNVLQLGFLAVLNRTTPFEQNAPLRTRYLIISNDFSLLVLRPKFLFCKNPSIFLQVSLKFNDRYLSSWQAHLKTG